MTRTAPIADHAERYLLDRLLELKQRGFVRVADTHSIPRDQIAFRTAVKRGLVRVDGARFVLTAAGAARAAELAAPAPVAVEVAPPAKRARRARRAAA